MCSDIDIKVVFDVKEARSDGGGDEADDERSRHRRIGKGHVADRSLVMLSGHYGRRG